MSQFTGIYLVTKESGAISRWEFPIVPSVGDDVEIKVHVLQKYKVESLKYIIDANEWVVFVFLKEVK